jgi:hypothetical protein
MKGTGGLSGAVTTNIVLKVIRAAGANMSMTRFYIGRLLTLSMQCLKNRNQLILKWQRLVVEDDVLKRIYAKRFLAIFSTVKPIEKFDFALYFKLVEKITVQEEGRLLVTLHEGTEIECDIK